MLNQLIRRIHELSRLHRDISRVKSLDDHLLADMGIERDSIGILLRRGKR